MTAASTRPWRVSFDLGVALAYVIAIFILGSLPGSPPVARAVSDKLQHAVGFGLLAWLWCRALYRLRPGASLARIGFGGFLVSVGVGGALELWQALLSYRTCEFLDWVADMAGALVAVGLYTLIRQWRAARPSALE